MRCPRRHVLPVMAKSAGRSCLCGMLLWAALHTVSSPALAQNVALLVKDIHPGGQGSFPSEFTEYDGALFLFALDAIHGGELWRSDGTEAGTSLFKDIWPGPGSSSTETEFEIIAGMLYFAARDSAHGVELWRTDGTPSGTQLVLDIRPGPEDGVNVFASFAHVGQTLFFAGDEGTTGHELWKSDGTAAGTVLVKDINPFGSSNIQGLTAVGGTVFFSANDGTTGNELWTSDGTDSGTVLLKDVWPGSPGSNPLGFTDVGGRLFFTAFYNVVGMEPWISDGTTDGTRMVSDINPGSTGSMDFTLDTFTDLGGTAFFLADDGTHGCELWRSDGTALGTQLVVDLWVGPSSGTSEFGGLSNIGARLFFNGTDGNGAPEPWTSDGTAAGTFFLRDVWPGANTSLAYAYTDVGGIAFFSADDSTHGRELWKSDGTPEGTVLVRDIYPGEEQSDPLWLTTANGTLFFRANDGVYGEELWKADFAPEISIATPTVAFPTVTVGDTIVAAIVISNDGALPLTILDVQLPTSEMRLVQPVPFDIAPGARDSVVILLEPTVGIDASGDIIIASNDPITPTSTLPSTTDIRALQIKGKLLSPEPVLPLGQAATVIVSPFPDVHVEQGVVYYRAAGTGTFRDSLALSPFDDDFIAVIPGPQVTEAGLEYYFRVENSGIVATDPPGAPADSIFFHAVAAPDSITAVPQPNQGSDIVTDADIVVRVSLPQGATFVQGRMFVRQGGKRDYIATSVQPDRTGATGIIPDSLVGPSGVEYWVEVQTLTATVTDPPTDAAGRPRTLQVTVPDLAEPAAHPGERYRLFSVPLDLEGTIAGALTDDLGGPDKTEWRLFAYENNSAKYVELPNDSINTFDLGHGYWLITRDRRRVDTGPVRGRSTPTDGVFPLVLGPGFNLIASPFTFPISWDSVTVDGLRMPSAEAGVVEPPVAWQPGSGYVFDVRTLVGFEGYWVNNLTDSNVVLEIPPAEAPAAHANSSIARGLPSEAEDTWKMEIRASSESGHDDHNYIGVTPGAKTTWDEHDRSEPPMSPGHALSLYFPHLDWDEHPGRYASDIRGGYGPVDVEGLGVVTLEEGLWGHVWTFDVASRPSDDAAGDALSLEFSGIDDIHPAATLYLVDRELDQVIDLRREARYDYYQTARDFVHREEDARFVLLVGGQDFIASHDDALPKLPTETALHQNHPNPFNPHTLVRFELAQPGNVSLRIYDLRGALVRVLEQRHREPGRYEIGWNAENDRGEKVASGVYFIRLTLGRFSQTRKMLLLK